MPRPQQTFQLPDLILLTDPLTYSLRVNQHCRAVSEASGAWLQSLGLDLDVDSINELGSLKGLKLGLLAALMFPACDPPQLRLLTDVLSLMFLSNAQWARRGEEGLWNSTSKAELPLEILSSHNILYQYVSTLYLLLPLLLNVKSLVEDPKSHLRRLISKASPSSLAQFTSTLNSYRSAQLSEINPTEGFTRHLVNAYGLPVLWHIAELAEIYEPPSRGLSTLREVVNELIILIFETMAFPLLLVDTTSITLPNASKSCRATPSFVSALIKQQTLSTQGALNLCGTLIKEKFDTFLSLEMTILSPRTAPSLMSWLFSSAVQSQTVQMAETTRFSRAMRDAIIGCIHWSYESEVFFGKKGAQVRTFGWVFIGDQ